MGLLGFLGKLLIVSSILFQAYLLYEDKSHSDQFQRNLKEAVASCQHLQQLRPHLEKYLRLVVVGLLGSSVLIVILRCSIFKLTTLIGLSILLWLEHHSVFCRVPTLDLLNNSPFWHSLGVIGAILYLLAAECTSCSKPANDSVATEERPTTTSNAAPKGGRKGRKTDWYMLSFICIHINIIQEGDTDVFIGVELFYSTLSIFFSCSNFRKCLTGAIIHYIKKCVPYASKGSKTTNCDLLFGL